MKKTRTNKYKITGDFGMDDIGDIVDCIVLLESEGHALVYHPRESAKRTCASLEVCVYDYDTDCWVAADPKDAYVNIGRKAELDKLKANLHKISYKDTVRKFYLSKNDVAKLAKANKKGATKTT